MLKRCPFPMQMIQHAGFANDFHCSFQHNKTFPTDNADPTDSLPLQLGFILDSDDWEKNETGSSERRLQPKEFP